MTPPNNWPQLGRVVATRGALALMAERQINAAQLLDRYQAGDWGDIDASDKAANDRAARDGSDRIVASYGEPGDPGRLWIITEIDRSVTTILRPDDY